MASQTRKKLWRDLILSICSFIGSLWFAIAVISCDLQWLTCHWITYSNIVIFWFHGDFNKTNHI